MDFDVMLRWHFFSRCLQKKEDEMTEYITKATNEQAEAEAEIREKGHRIAEYQNMVKHL